MRADSAKVKRIAKVLSYGIEWLQSDSQPPLYKCGALEAVAHIGACMITQDLTKTSTQTYEVVDMICDNPHPRTLRGRIARYAKVEKS